MSGEGVLRAFPSNAISPQYGGMSLRDYFAGQALAGLLAHASGEDPKAAPPMAYKLADAMLDQREFREVDQ